MTVFRLHDRNIIEKLMDFFASLFDLCPHDGLRTVKKDCMDISRTNKYYLFYHYNIFDGYTSVDFRNFMSGFPDETVLCNCGHVGKPVLKRIVYENVVFGCEVCNLSLTYTNKIDYDNMIKKKGESKW